MAAVILVGTQWGDEGKGKVTDFLSERADAVVRYQGGSNAGHTVEVEEQQFKLHLVPSGILYPHTLCLIASGVVVDLEQLNLEIKSLEERGIDIGNLRLSSRATLVMPYHKKIDEIQERTGKIGTTGRGIGPAYADKINRVGFRVADLLYDPEFKERFKAEVERKNLYFEKLHDEPGYDYRELYDQLWAQIEPLRPYIGDTSHLVYELLKAGKKVLFEGAQGTLLDIDHGTYPYVTSSHPIAGGACVGAGIGPTRIDRVIGVAKAYTTRVGEGPFPAELEGPLGNVLREKGAEFGTTTGRPRRCGWLDGVILRYAARINGLTDLAITKLDVLDSFETLKICLHYRNNGRVVTEFPENLTLQKECTPEYIELPGWQQDTTGITRYEDLPVNARAYIEKIEEITGVRQVLISLGPRRDQTITGGSFF